MLDNKTEEKKDSELKDSHAPNEHGPVESHEHAESHDVDHLSTPHLFEHVQTPEFTVRFACEPHSIAIWYNRSTQHKPVNDYFPAHRRMERITIDGDRPY